MNGLPHESICISLWAVAFEKEI